MCKCFLRYCLCGYFWGSCFFLLPGTSHTLCIQTQVLLLSISFWTVTILIPKEKPQGCSKRGRWGSESSLLRLPGRKFSFSVEEGTDPNASGPEWCIQGTAVLAVHCRACVPLKGGWGLSPAPADYGNMLSIAKSPGILREAKNLYYGKFLDFENTMWAK